MEVILLSPKSSNLCAGSLFGEVILSNQDGELGLEKQGKRKYQDHGMVTSWWLWLWAIRAPSCWDLLRSCKAFLLEFCT